MSRSSAEVMGVPDQLYHWIPGEMVVVVRLPRLLIEDAQDALVEQIRAQLNTFLAPYQLALEPYGSYGRWRENPTLPPVRRQFFLFGLQRKQPLAALFFHTRYTHDQEGDPVPGALSHIQAHLEDFAQTGLHILSAMPNWLVTAAPIFYAEGGAAVPPRPAPVLEVTTPPNTLPGWRMKFVDENISLDGGAEDVLVAVLDTAPHPDRILSAAARPELRRNWLLQRLASDLRHEDGSFVIDYDRYASSDDVRTGRDAKGQARYYQMPDHGLAVAGLVRDVAPRAQIRLLRVLNDFGGGNLYGLFAAVTDLEREMVAGHIRRLILNCSFLVMPDVRRLPYIWFDHRQWPTTQLSGVMRVLNHIEEGVRLLFESLVAQGALIVAAAGNDSVQAKEQGLPPRPPRAPARYESILAVTALNSSYTPASFANAANIPPYESGVATFGGESAGALDESGFPDAVRALYISPTFANGDENTGGWADWCGTSFATPIISGLAAHLLSQGWSAANCITRLSAGQERREGAVFGSPPEAREILANIIRVQQRYTL